MLTTRRNARAARTGWNGMLLACLFFGCTATAMAASAGIAKGGPAKLVGGGPTQIEGAPTAMVSSSESMIALRHQHHMWQTSDGAVHALINRGTQPGGNALQLYSSFDNAANWTGGLMVPRSGNVTASDGYLDNDVLYLAHSTPAGEVVFTVLQYDIVSGTWSRVWFETAFSSPDVFAVNPAIATDAAGTVWLVFTANESSTGNYSIKMLRYTTPEEGWVDTGFVFGAVDSLSNERSARPVPTSYGMAMVYSVHDTIYWAWRNNRSPLDRPWESREVFTSTSGDLDPYSSLFSVVVDDRDNIHLALTDGGRLGYLRLNTRRMVPVAKWLSGNILGGYVQTSIADGNLVIATNVSDRVGIYQSQDGGNSFTYTHLLTHNLQPGEYSNPRLETPAAVSGPIPLLQQYRDGVDQLLLTFSVPVL